MPGFSFRIDAGDIDNADEYVMGIAPTLTHAEVMAILTRIADHNDKMQIRDTIRDNSELMIII